MISKINIYGKKKHNSCQILKQTGNTQANIIYLTKLDICYELIRYVGVYSNCISYTRILLGKVKIFFFSDLVIV